MENTHIMTEIEILKGAMNYGFVKFVYNKKDGSERVAIGTRNMDFIDQVGGTPKGGEDKREKNPLLCTYYDLTKGAWRCFRTDLFKHIVFGENGEKNISKESACAQALAIAINDTETDIQSVMSNVTALIGTASTTKLANCVCNHKDDDFSTLYNECMELIAPTQMSKPTTTTTHTTNTQMSSGSTPSRLVELCKEELKLKERLEEIEREKRELLKTL